MKLSKLFCSAGLVVIAGVVIGAAAGGREAWGEGDSVQRVVGEVFTRQKLQSLRRGLARAAAQAENKPSHSNMLALHFALVQVAKNLNDTAATLQGLAEAMNVASVKWGPVGVAPEAMLNFTAKNPSVPSIFQLQQTVATTRPSKTTPRKR